MKIDRRSLALGATALAAGTVLSATTGAHAAETAASVEAALDALRTAMLSPEKAALDALFLPNATYGHTDGRLQTKDEVIADLLARKTEWKSISLTEPRISTSGNTAVARVLFTGEAEQRGKTVTPKIQMLVVYRDDGHGWKILTRQGYATV